MIIIKLTLSFLRLTVKRCRRCLKEQETYTSIPTAEKGISNSKIITMSNMQEVTPLSPSIHYVTGKQTVKAAQAHQGSSSDTSIRLCLPNNKCKRAIKRENERTTADLEIEFGVGDKKLIKRQNFR